MLAFEYENPESYGAVHHLTVACYNLQHPGGFTEAALAWMRASVAVAVNSGEPPQEWLRRARQQFNGKNKVKVVRGPEEVPTRLPANLHWSMTVADIPLDSSTAYVAGVQAWARQVLADL